MLQPVLGDVAIDEGIGGDRGEAKNEEQPQPERGQRGKQKKSKVLAHKLAHAKNIPQLSDRVGACISSQSRATDVPRILQIILR